jgi:hypothetical protein
MRVSGLHATDPSRSLTLAVLLPAKLRWDTGTARVDGLWLVKGGWGFRR